MGWAFLGNFDQGEAGGTERWWKNGELGDRQIAASGGWKCVDHECGSLPVFKWMPARGVL